MDNVKRLIELSQKGDSNAFEKLVILYQNKIYNLCYHLTNNHTEAEDLAQEVFVKAYFGLDGFRNEADFSTWLHRITINLWINIKHKQKNPPAISLDKPVPTEEGEVVREIATTSTNPQEVLENKEFRILVYTALHSLSKEQQAVLTLREIQGYSYEEISRIMQCSTGTVKSRLSRARQALQNKVLTLAKENNIILPLKSSQI